MRDKNNSYLHGSNMTQNKNEKDHDNMSKGTKNIKNKLYKWLYSPKQHDSNRQRKNHC